jgi:hypothetical protein
MKGLLESQCGEEHIVALHGEQSFFFEHARESQHDLQIEL